MVAVVAEWLRRLTRNQIPSGSAGSSPADCEEIFLKIYIYIIIDLHKQTSLLVHFPTKREKVPAVRLEGKNTIL